MEHYCLAADIGGTSVKLGLFSSEYTLVAHWELPSGHKASNSLLSDILQSFEEHMQAHAVLPEQILGLGVAVPGPVLPGGVVNQCLNLGWDVLCLPDVLTELGSPFPVWVGNDANLAALGEYHFGEYSKDLLMVTLGTGIGGGLVINGKEYAGAHGAAGEIGHITVNPREREVCTCGKRGCLEQTASATGIVRTAHAFLKKATLPSALSEIENFTARDVFECARRGDDLAGAVVDTACCALGLALSNICCVCNPAHIILGGGVSKAGDFLLEKVKRQFLSFSPYFLRQTTLSLAKLGSLAGLYGCAAQVLQDPLQKKKASPTV